MEESKDQKCDEKQEKGQKDSKAQVQSEKDREVEKRMDQTCDEKKAKNKNGNHKQADKADKRHKTRKYKWTDVPNSKSQKRPKKKKSVQYQPDPCNSHNISDLLTFYFSEYTCGNNIKVTDI